MQTGISGMDKQQAPTTGNYTQYPIINGIVIQIYFNNFLKFLVIISSDYF